MPDLKPVNDFFMIEIQKNPQGFVDNLNIKEEGIMEGLVISISEDAIYYGANTFMFDSSLNDKGLLSEIHNHYKKYVGKKVWWPMRTESGAIIEKDSKQFVFVKWSAIMAFEEDN